MCSLLTGLLFGKNQKEIQQKARQEVILLMGDRPKDIIPSVDELQHMTYLDMIIKEVIQS